MPDRVLSLRGNHSVDFTRIISAILQRHLKLANVLYRTRGAEAEMGLRLTGILWWFWKLRGYWTEGREWLARVLALPGVERFPAAYARALNAAGTMAERGSFLRWREIPTAVWALGFVSLFMDLSSEMIHALLPIYLVSVLGASMVTVGIIEGIAEATASITKIFSGALSDWLGKRKWLAAAGYGLAAFTKPVFPLAPTVAVTVA